MKSLLLTGLFVSVSAFAQNSALVLEPGQFVQMGNVAVGCKEVPTAPAPTGPACGLIGKGMVGTSLHDFRITVDGAVLSGTYSLKKALESLQKYRDAGVCVRGAAKACKLSGPGRVLGVWYEFRLEFAENVEIGFSSEKEAFETLFQLRNAGICQ